MHIFPFHWQPAPSPSADSPTPSPSADSPTPSPSDSQSSAVLWLSIALGIFVILLIAIIVISRQSSRVTRMPMPASTIIRKSSLPGAQQYTVITS